MDVLAVILAASAVGRPHFAGRPSALHAVERALGARHVVRICLVTGDADLGRQASDLGAEVIPPPSNSDRAAMLRAAIEASAEGGFAPALAILVDAAFPLCDAASIDGAIEHLWRCGADSLVAVYPLDEALWIQDESSVARPLDPRSSQRRYVETPAITGVRVGEFERTGELPTGRVVLFEMPMTTALRLDEHSDWRQMEGLARRLSQARAKALLRGIRLLVLDFDGVMTDNRVLVLEDGREAVLCSRGDGMGIGLLKAAGVPVAVLSKEINAVVGARCRKLGIACRQGVDDKLTELRRMVAEHHLDLAQIAYMGNDVNDLECMNAAGVAVAPADAHPQAVRAAALVTAAVGGEGAVREICDLLLEVQAGTEQAVTPSP